MDLMRIREVCLISMESRAWLVVFLQLVRLLLLHFPLLLLPRFKLCFNFKCIFLDILFFLHILIYGSSTKNHIINRKKLLGLICLEFPIVTIKLPFAFCSQKLISMDEFSLLRD